MSDSSLRGTKGDRFSVSRRNFLKASSLAGVAVVAGRLIKYPQIAPPEPLRESAQETVTEKWVTTSCLNCSTRCATQVRVANGKAVRITGNPLSQVSEGEVCPRGHIGLQVLYDPDRVSSPLKRTNPVKGRGIDPKWQSISWSQALTEVSARLKALRDKAQPHQLLLLHGLNAISDEDMIHRLAEAYGTPNVIAEDTLDKEAEKLGRWLADGNYGHIAYDIEHTNYILAFGAGILEFEKPLARNLRMWGKIRREKSNRAKVVVIDPRYSVTAAKADQWLPVNPGTDGALAMSLAYVILSEGLYDADFVRNWTTGFDEFRELVLQSKMAEEPVDIARHWINNFEEGTDERNEDAWLYYSPERVARITGISADTM